MNSTCSLVSVIIIPTPQNLSSVRIKFFVIGDVVIVIYVSFFLKSTLFPVTDP